MVQLLLLVALLVGLSVGSLTLGLGFGLRRRPGSRRKLRRSRSPTSYAERILPVLKIVTAPRWIARRWASGDTGLQLRQAGLCWQAEDYAALRWMSLWLGAFAGLSLAALRGWDLVGCFLALASTAGGVAGPQLWLAWRLERRQIEIDLALPDFLDRLALGLEAGLGFEVALRRIAVRFPGLLGEGLRALVRKFDRGHQREQALDELATDHPSHDLRAYVAAVKQADRLGTSLAVTLRVQTALLRAHRRRRAQEAGRRLPILIVFPLVFMFLPALMIIYLTPPVLHLLFGR